MIRPLIPILLLSTLCACNARWQSLHASDVPAAQATAGDLHDFAGTGRAQGHRDFPAGFDSVWRATVDTLHTRGVGVPKSAVPQGKSFNLDLEGLHVLVEERFPGRVCVLVRFRVLKEEEGRAQSLLLLDEILARLSAP